MSTFTPSPQQATVFSTVLSSTSNVIIVAVAGSGKTTTLLELLRRIPRGTSFLEDSKLFLSFSKSTVDVLASRVPRGVSCATFNSLGLRALRNSNLLHPDFKIDTLKVSKLVTNAVGFDNEDRPNITRLVSLTKSLSPSTNITWHDLIRHHNLSFINERQAQDVTRAVLSASDADRRTIDFDDMLRLPVLLNASFDKQDWIFVDEAQDTNPIQIEILSRLMHNWSQDDAEVSWGSAKFSRLIAVGDPLQAIYGFRGADADALSSIEKRFYCVRLPLSVSYRCSQAVVSEALKQIKLHTPSFA